MSDYYDRDGRPIGMMEWARRFGTAERIVVIDQIGPYRVSTIWLGLDHALFGGPPMIFETMIFTDGDSSAENVDYQERYPTEEMAREGHRRAVQMARERTVNPAKECTVCDD